MPSIFFLALPIHVIIIQNALNLMKFCEFFLVANCDYFSDDFFFWLAQQVGKKQDSAEKEGKSERK